MKVIVIPRVQSTNGIFTFIKYDCNFSLILRELRWCLHLIPYLRNTILNLLLKKGRFAACIDRIPEYFYSNLFIFPFKERIAIALREIAN